MKIVLLISCAHALVHLLEQSIASVESVISKEYDLTKLQSGYLGSALRFPYGIGAIVAGLLADRFGGRRVLLVYLFGSAIVCGSFLLSRNAGMIYGQLFLLGSLASIYHPAGLGLLSNETTVANRSKALGLHGIFGSLGIASAPLLAAVVLSARSHQWRTYYLLLAVICTFLGLLIFWTFKPSSTTKTSSSAPKDSVVPGSQLSLQIKPYLLMILSGACGGVVYGGVLHFLPRYLQDSGLESSGISFLTQGNGSDLSVMGNYAAAFALVCGAFGQFTAGRWASAPKLPRQIATVYALNIPCLLWMSVAEGPTRLLAASLWAFVHFMNQPLYNSLLAEFVPRHRRSVGFGISHMLGFGIGAVGPALFGWVADVWKDDTFCYAVLAAFALTSSLLILPLMNPHFARRESDESTTS